MDREKKEFLYKLLLEKQNRVKNRKISTYYPDFGKFRRELYPKHLQFFELGKTKKERLFMAANRVGKTEGAGGVETTHHLTGNYPKWWKGRVFNRPISCWVAGDTSKTVREILQLKLLGPIHEMGTGLIPKENILDFTRKTGTADAIDTVYIKHKQGTSQLTFKSYDQKRFSFQGTEQDLIWLDEEPPLDIYTECLLRTTDTSGDKEGMIMLTFTPLSGMSETVLQFLEGAEIKENVSDSKAVITATWDDVPHLSEETKKTLLASIPPYQRDARSKGIPQLGSGAIYPVPESEILVDPFQIPDEWQRSFAMDVGWNKTAALWQAYDREHDTIYIFAEHYKGQAEPSIHAESIRAKGDWIRGVIDPASRGRNQKDGESLLYLYQQLGLDLTPANNAVETGLYEVWQRLSTGRLKVFKTCQNFVEEYRLYRRDEKGHVVKTKDHLMDCLRYLVMSGLSVARTKPVKKKPEYSFSSGEGWLG